MARHEVFPLCSSIIQWHLSLLTTTVAVCSPQWITASIQKWMTLKCLPKYLSAVSFPMHSAQTPPYAPLSNCLTTPDRKINWYHFPPKTKLFSHLSLSLPLHFLPLSLMSFSHSFFLPVAASIYFLFRLSGSVFPVKDNWSVLSLWHLCSHYAIPFHTHNYFCASNCSGVLRFTFPFRPSII